ncbi:MAG: hypothetical protein ABR928_18600 [Terracidiphilus sp.]|jgi:hypothetical protein
MKKFPLVLSLTALAVLTATFAYAQFSGWRSTDGNRDIEYRWQSYGGGATVPKCEIQLRNNNSDDHKQYNLEIDYTDPQGEDQAYRGYGAGNKEKK